MGILLDKRCICEKGVWGFHVLSGGVPLSQNPQTWKVSNAHVIGIFKEASLCGQMDH